MLASIVGPDLLIIVAVVLVLFGGSQIPKLARSLGSAKSEFEKATAKSTPTPHTAETVVVPVAVPVPNHVEN